MGWDLSQQLESQGGIMNARQFIVLFLASLSMSLIILIAFFSLFFKNLNIEFNAKMPESAPIPSAPIVESNKSSGLTHAKVNLPPEDALPMVGIGSNPAMPEAPPPPPVVEEAVIPGDPAAASLEAVPSPQRAPANSSPPVPILEPPPPPLPPVPDEPQ
jgi:type IV secretory pathway VirB10-like protein